MDSLSREELKQVVESLLNEINSTRDDKLSLAQALELALPKKQWVDEINEEPKKTRKDKKQKKKKEVPFDMNKYKQRHIAFQVQYDGSDYSGFAAQENEDTVEDKLFKSLQKLRLIEDRKTSNYSRCGRTDKGVSALGQVVAFNLRSSIPKDVPDHAFPRHPNDPVTQASASASHKQIGTESNVRPLLIIKEMDYCSMMNNSLPEDIRIVSWTEVDPAFSARFSATYRTYRYFFIRKDLNIPAMKQAASYIIGEHDFRNLCKMDIANVSNFRREIYSAQIDCFIEHEDPKRAVWKFEVKGIAFLWHMVRCIMSVLFMVGENGEQPEVIRQLLDVDSNPCKPSYTMAPERPLVLHECGFEALHLSMQPRNLWQLTAHYEALWERHSVSAARAMNSLLFLKEKCVRAVDLSEFVSSMCDKKQRKRLLGSDTGSEKKRKEGKEEDRAISSGGDMGGEGGDKVREGGESGEQTVTEMEYTPTGMEEVQKEVQWGEALMDIHSLYGFKPSLNRTPYVPLMQRKREGTYEDKLKNLGGNKKENFDRHTELSVAGKQSGSTGEFFKKMQGLGSVQ